jgi:aminomethyltransferase
VEDIKQTPLLREHQALGAQMLPFGGWLMPIQYSGILAESTWCRENASLFDTCHMGEFRFRGDFAASGIERLFSCRLETIPVGRGRYGFLLNDAGGIVDDLVIFRLSDNEAMIVVNAGTTEKDFRAIRSGLKDDHVLEDISPETGKLDIQGPLSRETLEKVCGISVADIPYFGFKKIDIFGEEAIVSRTGYTGELGYEIYSNNEAIGEYWRRLLSDDRVKPAGLGARDVLRQEMGYCLYGSDIDETITPLEADLAQFVDFSKDFIGRDVLIRQQEDGVSRIRVAFRVNSRRSPRHHYQIFRGDQLVGHVTSGVFSPMLGCGIGMGYVTPEAAAPGTSLVIRHEAVSMEAEVTNLPFYKGGSLRRKVLAAGN